MIYVEYFIAMQLNNTTYRNLNYPDFTPNLYHYYPP